MTGFTKLLSFVSKLHVHMGMLWASSLELGRQGYHFQSCLFSFESRELVWSPASLWQHKKLEPVGRLLYLKIPFHQLQLYRKTTVSTTSRQNILKVSWKWKLHTGVSLFVSLRNRTGEELEDGKTLVCDKRDRAITCAFCRDLVLYRKMCLKENEVWRKVVSNKINVTPVTQGLLSSFLSRPAA